MKNKLVWTLGVASLFAAPALAQDVSSAGPQIQQKKSSRVIDNENIGSILANTGDVQNASAASVFGSEGDRKDPAFTDDDGNILTPKEEVVRRKEEEKAWLDTIETCKKKMESAPSDSERDLWKQNIASMESKLEVTRKALAKAEAALAAQNPDSQPASATDHAGASSERIGTEDRQ